MLINSNGFPVRIIGITSVTHDLVDFLNDEKQSCESIRFEDAVKDEDAGQYQYLVGVLRNLELKNSIVDWINLHGYHCPTFVHDQSFVQHKNKLGKGTLVFPMASVLDSVVGDFCVITPNCHIGHWAEIGDRCLLFPGSMVLGSSYLDSGTVLQAAAIVSNQVKITQKNVNILPKSMVTKDINCVGTYGGTPARKITSLSTLESDYFR